MKGRHGAKILPEMKQIGACCSKKTGKLLIAGWPTDLSGLSARSTVAR